MDRWAWRARRSTALLTVFSHPMNDSLQPPSLERPMRTKKDCDWADMVDGCHSLKALLGPTEQIYYDPVDEAADVAPHSLAMDQYVTVVVLHPDQMHVFSAAATLSHRLTQARKGGNRVS